MGGASTPFLLKFIYHHTETIFFQRLAILYVFLTADDITFHRVNPPIQMKPISKKASILYHVKNYCGAVKAIHCGRPAQWLGKARKVQFKIFQN